MATRADWKIAAFAEGELIPYRASFTHSEFTTIARGLLPKTMEDKWFAFYEAPYLYIHRSWTGQAVYRLAFTEARNCVELTEALCAREVLERSTPAYQANLVHWLIHNLLLGAAEPFPLPPGQKSIDGAYQHHIAGTGFPETETFSANRKRWSPLTALFKRLKP
jgi:hypothetical protein